MSGLSSIISFQTPLPQGQLEEMLKWTAPVFAAKESQNEGATFSFQNCTLGTLCPDSIISDANKSVWIVFCGQLFSTLDTLQKILDRYLEVGESCFNEVDGKYAFLILDSRSKELFVVRDRAGIYPVYWHINAKYAYVSTSLKAILSTGSISPTPDLSGIAQSLSLGFISQDVTCIEGVNRLLPGYYLKIALEGSYSIVPYWSYSSTFAKQYSSQFDSSIEIYCELERRIKNSISKTRSSLTHTKAACQSGTIGSYILWQSIKEGSNESPVLINPEISASDFLSSLIPMVWAMEMPNAEISSLETWNYVTACKQQKLNCYFDTGFSAEFYDYSKDAKRLFQSHYEIRHRFESSFWTRLAFKLRPRKHLDTLRTMQEATPQVAFIENKLLLTPNEFEKAAPELSNYFDTNLFIHQFYNLSRIPKLDASLFYLTMKSAVTDGLSESRIKIAQSHGVETQSPFLDYHLLEFFSSIAPEVWASPDLISSFQSFWGQSHEITHEIAAWPKTAPIPESIFLSPEVWPWFCGLESGMLVDTGLVSATWIQKALKTPKQNLHSLYAMLILEIWMRLFIDLPLRESNKDLRLEDLLNKGKTY